MTWCSSLKHPVVFGRVLKTVGTKQNEKLQLKITVKTKAICVSG